MNTDTDNKGFTAALNGNRIASSSGAFICSLSPIDRHCACFSIWSDNAIVYWSFKISGIYMALAISIVLTAFWEEWVVWRFSRAAATDTGFAVPVLRANLLVLVAVMTLAAALMLPKRLKSPDFLVPLKEQVTVR